jgi:hypothetical protein
MRTRTTLARQAATSRSSTTCRRWTARRARLGWPRTCRRAYCSCARAGAGWGGGGGARREQDTWQHSSRGAHSIPTHPNPDPAPAQHLLHPGQLLGQGGPHAHRPVSGRPRGRELRHRPAGAPGGPLAGCALSRRSLGPYFKPFLPPTRPMSPGSSTGSRATTLTASWSSTSATRCGRWRGRGRRRRRLCSRVERSGKAGASAYSCSASHAQCAAPVALAHVKPPINHHQSRRPRTSCRARRRRAPRSPPR